MATTHDYKAKVEWSGAAAGPTADYQSYSREYTVHIDGKPSIKGSADPAFKGDPALHNPEDMLVVSLSACHMLSYLALCAMAGIAVESYEDDAQGTMEASGGGGHFTEVVLHPKVVLAAGADQDKAMALHEKAHKVCFVAASVNFPVRHEVSITA
ncbi:MAG: OsmC family protein [Gammaproteobacteria bacterium]